MGTHDKAQTAAATGGMSRLGTVVQGGWQLSKGQRCWASWGRRWQPQATLPMSGDAKGPGETGPSGLGQSQGFSTWGSRGVSPAHGVTSTKRLRTPGLSGGRYALWGQTGQLQLVIQQSPCSGSHPGERDCPEAEDRARAQGPALGSSVWSQCRVVPQGERLNGACSRAACKPPGTGSERNHRNWPSALMEWSLGAAPLSAPGPHLQRLPQRGPSPDGASWTPPPCDVFFGLSPGLCLASPPAAGHYNLL